MSGAAGLRPIGVGAGGGAAGAAATAPIATTPATDQPAVELTSVHATFDSKSDADTGAPAATAAAAAGESLSYAELRTSVDELAVTLGRLTDVRDGEPMHSPKGPIVDTKAVEDVLGAIDEVAALLVEAENDASLSPDERSANAALLARVRSLLAAHRKPKDPSIIAHTPATGGPTVALIPAPPGSGSGSAPDVKTNGLSGSVSSLKGGRSDSVDEAGGAGRVRFRTMEEAGLGQDEFDRNPEERANCCNFMFNSFVTPLITLGYERPLEAKDLWKIAKVDESKALTRNFEARYAEKKAVKPDASLYALSIAVNKWQIAKLFALEVPSKAESLVQPIFLQLMIEWVSHKDLSDPDYQAPWIGFVVAAAMLVVAWVCGICRSQSSNFGMRAFIAVRNAISGMVYEKALRLSHAGKKESTVGEIVNLMSGKTHATLLLRCCCRRAPRVLSFADPPPRLPGGTGCAGDAEKLGSACSYGITFSFTVPTQLALSIWLIYRLLGPATFAGLAVMFVLAPMLGAVMVRTIKYYIGRAKLADSRVKLTTEVLQGIRVVKQYGWEESFTARLGAIRLQELEHLRNLNFNNSFW
jgi:hypothetical protein